MEWSNSQKIYEAYRFVRTVTEEIDSLKKALDEAIAKASSSDPKYYLEYDGNEDEQKPNGRDYWLCESWCVSYRLYEKRRKKALGYLYYLFDLSYPGGPAEQLKQSVICVGYVGAQALKKHPQEMKIDVFYPWYPTEIDKKGYQWAVTKGSKIWHWKGGKSDLSDVENTCWVYFVPLATIETHNNVLDTLVEPALGVLHNKPERLANDARVLRFENESFKLITD